MIRRPKMLSFIAWVSIAPDSFIRIVYSFSLRQHIQRHSLQIHGSWIIDKRHIIIFDGPFHVLERKIKMRKPRRPIIETDRTHFLWPLKMHYPRNCTHANDKSMEKLSQFQMIDWVSHSMNGRKSSAVFHVIFSFYFLLNRLSAIQNSQAKRLSTFLSPFLRPIRRTWAFCRHYSSIPVTGNWCTMWHRRTNPFVLKAMHWKQHVRGK